MKKGFFFSGLFGQVGKNTLWALISRFGAQALAVVFTVFVARRLDSAGFGAYAFIAAIVFVANSLTTFGTDMLLIREIAARNDLLRLPAALIVQLLLSAAIIILIWFGGAWLPNQDSQTISALRIYSFALIPLAFFTVFTTALRGVQRMDTYMWLNLTISALQVGAVLIPGLDVIRLSLYLLLVQIAGTVVAGFLCTRTIPYFWEAWQTPPLHLWTLLREAAPIAFLAVLGMVYQRLSIYMLSTMSGAAPTGIYAAASRIVEASKGFHLAAFAALYPMMVQANKDLIERVRWREVFQASWRFLLGGAFLVCLTLSAAASPLVRLLYGANYSASAEPLTILAWCLIPYTINSFLTLDLLASQREHLAVLAFATSLTCLAAMNYAWIPVRGPEGSAWAALGAESVQAVLLLLLSSNTIRQRRSNELSKLSEQIRG